MLDVQLQIFKTVVEKKSFSLAAQELHMTQSSVSQHIQALEIYFGAKLFDRRDPKLQPKSDFMLGQDLMQGEAK